MADFESLRKKHLADVSAFSAEAVRRLSWSRERVAEEQTQRLRTIVAAAQEGSAFHADRLGHLEATKLELSDLPKIPPMTKNDVMTNWDRVVTDGRLRLADVNAHLKRVLSGEEKNPYYLDEYYAAATGGSSGTRGLFLWDWETFVITANITLRMEVQQDLAEPPSGPKRTAVVCAGSYVHGSRFLFPAMIDPERDVLVLPANLSIPKMVDRLNDYQPDRIIGYSSMVEELCAEALDGRLKIKPNRVSANSEPLPRQARDMAKQAWGINVHNQWGSVEIGLAGTEGNSFSGMTMAEDFLIFEPVDDHDQPVADAASADRLLVTKLYGQVMPMIRYELTDTVIIDGGPNPDAPGYRRITDIKGRADNWFVYEDKQKIHPMIFRSVLGQEPHISEYQVQQTPRGARVLAIVHGEIPTTDLTNALIGSLTEAGLPNAEVTIETVTDLPRHPETNKLKRFVPLR
jgi:phenylacetate-coenzyme A ligase PaaK-like adenylate-forming protein